MISCTLKLIQRVGLMVLFHKNMRRDRTHLGCARSVIISTEMVLWCVHTFRVNKLDIFHLDS